MVTTRRRAQQEQEQDGSSQQGRGSASGVPERQPTAVPEFTLGTLRKAIPAHCFERSMARSFGYLAVDVAVCSLLWWASTFIDSTPKPLPYLLWPLYWFFQGAFGTGIWVIAHECGHGAFSKSEAVNDTVGLIFHSILLVPYYSWKHSHRRHHQNTGSAERDEVFPPTVLPAGAETPAWQKSFLYRASLLVFMSTIGWPIYLLTNLGGRVYDRFANHFDPFSPIFSKKERGEIVISDLGIGAVVAGLVVLGKTFGWLWLVKTYVIPYLIVNHWLVMITYLQHTHTKLAHYGEGEWDWLRGALSTVDRSYGFLDVIFHHIADTHVCHHLFSQLPHYHAQEATEAIKKVLGPYYQADNRNIVKAWWDATMCIDVKPDEPGQKIFWFK